MYSTCTTLFWKYLILSFVLLSPIRTFSAEEYTSNSRDYYDKHVIIAVDQYRGVNTKGADYKGIYEALVKILNNQPINNSDYMQCIIPETFQFDYRKDEASLFTFGLTTTGIKEIGGKPKNSIYEYILNNFFISAGKLSENKDGLEGFSSKIYKAVFLPRPCGNNYSSVVFPNIIGKITNKTRASEYYLFIISNFIGGATNVGNSVDVQSIIRDWFHGDTSYSKIWFESVASLEKQFTKTEILKVITNYDKSQKNADRTNALVLVGYKIEPKVFLGNSSVSLKNSVKLKETSFSSGKYEINGLEIDFPHDEYLRLDSTALVVKKEDQILRKVTFDNSKIVITGDIIKLPEMILELGNYNVGDTLKFHPLIYATPLDTRSKTEFLPLVINVPHQNFIFSSEVFKLAPTATYIIWAVVIALIAAILYAVWRYRGRLAKARVNVKIDNISKQRYMNINTSKDEGISVTNAPCWYLRPGVNEQRIHVTCSMQRAPLVFAKKYRIRLSYKVKDLDENYDFAFRPDGQESDGSLREKNKWYYADNGPFKDDVEFEFNAIAYVDSRRMPDFIERENILKLGICLKAELVNSKGEVMKLLDEQNDVSYEFIAKEYFPNRELWIALDPGTSGSCIAYGFGGTVVSRDNIHLARNFTKHTDGSQGWDSIFPSKIKISDDSTLFERPDSVEDAHIIERGGSGDFWFGNDAEQLWGRNSFQSIKKLLGYSNELPIKRNGQTPNVQHIAGRDLAHLLVKGLINRFENYLSYYTGGDNGTNDVNALNDVRPKFYKNGVFEPSRAIVTVPNNFTLVKTLDMVESVRRTNKFKEVHFLYEAEGVLMTYLRENWNKLKEKEKKDIIVFDMGGATINASAFRIKTSMRDYKGNEIVDDVTVETTSRIGYGVGGDDIDFALIQILMSIPTVSISIYDANNFILKHKKALLKYVKHLKLSYIDKEAHRMKSGNIMSNMETLWGSLRTAFSEWGVNLPEDFDVKDREYIKSELTNHYKINKYVKNNVRDAITELINSGKKLERNAEVIFSGRSTLYPGIKDTVKKCLEDSGISVTIWDGFNKAGHSDLDDEKVKTAVVIGACWYAMWSQYITIRHDIVTSTFGFIDMKDNKETFHPVVKSGEDLHNGHRMHEVEVFDPTNPNISFVQMLGTNFEEVWSKKIFHKMNKIAQLTDIDGDIDKVRIDVDDKNNFKYLVTEKSGVSHGGREIVKDIDILDENSEAYIFAAFTSEEEISSEKQSLERRDTKRGRGL